MSRQLFWTATIAMICAAMSWTFKGAVAQTSGATASGGAEASSADTSQATQSSDSDTAASDDLFGDSTPSAQSEQADTATLNETPSAVDAQSAAPSTQPGATVQPGATTPAGTPGSASAATGQQQTNLDTTNADARLRQQQRDLMAGLQFGQATDRGLTVANIAAGSIFLESGLRPGDVIIALDNQPIRSEAEFTRLIAMDPGQRVPMTVLRGGRQETIFFTYPDDRLATRPETDPEMMDRSAGYQANRPVDQTGGPGFLGVGFDTQFYNAAAVRDVLPGSAAEQAGLREGDVIVALNGQRVSSFEDAMRLIRSMQAGDSLEIEYTRRMPNRTQATLGARPASGPGAVSYGPADEVEVYRVGPQDDQLEPEPMPTDQGRDIPPPALPPDDYTPPEELP